MAEKPLIDLTNINNNIDTMKTNISTLKTNLTSLQSKASQLIYTTSCTHVTTLDFPVALENGRFYEIIFKGTFGYTDQTTACNIAIRPNKVNTYSNSQATFFEFTGSNSNFVNVNPEPNIRIARGKSGNTLIARTLLTNYSNSYLLTQTTYSSISSTATNSMCGMISTSRLNAATSISSFQLVATQANSDFTGDFKIYKLS